MARSAWGTAVSACAGVLSLAILLGCGGMMPQSVVDANKGGASTESADDTASAAAADDVQAQALLNEKDETAEAKDWLSPEKKSHTLWKGDRAAITKLVNDLYDSGATDIRAVGINKDGDAELAVMFVATLPADAESRKKVIGVHNDFWRSYLKDEDPEELKDFLAADHGQKYLLLNFDL